MLKMTVCLFFVASFNITAGLIASIAYSNVNYIQANASAYIILAVCLILIGDIAFINILLFKGIGRSESAFYKNFDSILKKYYNGGNFDEAFKKA